MGFCGFCKTHKSHDMVLVLLISMSWIQWHTSFWILIAFRFFHHFGASWILRRNVLIRKLSQPSFKFLPKIFFTYVSPKQWPFYGTFIKLSVHYSPNSSTFRPYLDKIALISCNLTTINLFPYCTQKVYHFMRFLGCSKDGDLEEIRKL